MKVSLRDEKRIRKLIESFLMNHGLSAWNMVDLIMIDDMSPGDDTAATIRIDDQQREFSIRVYTNYVGSYTDLSYYIIHELTHLFMYEVNAYIELLKRHDANNMFVVEAGDMYEKITYKLSKIFYDMYMEKL